jgi:hypothetical protein
MAASVSLAPRMAHGWGATGHRIVARVGSTIGGGFWAANVEGMVSLTTAPDAVYKRLPTANTEKPTHFFQPDSYFNDSSQFNLIPELYVDAAKQFGTSFVNKNGTAPWRAHQYYDLALAALKSGDYETALDYAGVMSHYIGDMSQPLHDTKNYDGAETGQKGIHAFFETTNIERADLDTTTEAVSKIANTLIQNATFRNDFNGNFNDVTFKEVDRAFALKDSLLSIDAKQGRKGAGAQNLLKLAEARMADGAATLALVLNQLWADAGNPSGGETVNAQVPAWQQPNYGQQSAVASSEQDDDCL